MNDYERYDLDLFMKACSDPMGYSGESYPDGTPMTNREKYLKQHSRANDWHQNYKYQNNKYIK